MTAVADHDFLGMLTPDEARALHSRGIVRHFRRGAAMLREGEDPTRVLVLLEGRAKAVTFTEDGKEVVLGFIAPGELLGEVATIESRPRSATVIALEPVTALALAAATSGRCSTSTRGSGSSCTGSSSVACGWRTCSARSSPARTRSSRVSRRLVELADTYGIESEDGVTITLPISQEELAGWTGASREAVTKALRTLATSAGSRPAAVRSRSATGGAAAVRALTL